MLGGTRERVTLGRVYVWLGWRAVEMTGVSSVGGLAEWGACEGGATRETQTLAIITRLGTRCYCSCKRSTALLRAF
jgi:hypothetical protein